MSKSLLKMYRAKEHIGTLQISMHLGVPSQSHRVVQKKNSVHARHQHFVLLMQISERQRNVPKEIQFASGKTQTVAHVHMAQPVPASNSIGWG